MLQTATAEKRRRAALLYYRANKPLISAAKKAKRESLSAEQKYEKNKKARDRAHSRLGTVGYRINRLVAEAKRRAKSRGIEFDIEASDVETVTHCPVLGIELRYSEPKMDNAPRDNSASLDRIVPDRGYVKGNVRIISMRANRLKCDATAEEMRLILDDIVAIEAAQNGKEII